MKMNIKSIGIGIGQLIVIVLVWMFNPNAMVERISDLLLVFGIGCVTGLIAPSMVTFAEDEYILTWAVIFELVYAVALVVLLGVIYYNIVI